MTRTNNKITLCNICFSLNACKNLSKKELDGLGNTARNFFHFVQAFGNKLKLRNFVNIWMVEDRIQDLDSVLVAYFSIIFTTICSTLAKKVRYKTKLDLTKGQ